MRVAVAALFLALSTPLFAQSTDPIIQGPPPPEGPGIIVKDDRGRITFRVTRTPTPINFDGRLDEPFYRSVPGFGDFIQQEPHEGQPATEKTEVWVFYDNDNLYVSARCWDSEPGHRIATEMRRDANNLYNNDHFGVSFDGFYDRRNGYGFAVNPLGGMLDWSIANEQPNNSWNGVWDVRTSEFEHGWTVEIKFPFRSFRYQEGSHVWGMNFRRMVRYKNEVAMLAPILASWGRPGMSRMSVAATAVGIETPGLALNLDVKPYALGSLLTDRNASPAVSNDPDGDVGVDVKWGITQSIIADFTYNTDFAQVEDDEAQINLTRFNLQFPEKREFFLEGADTFNFASGTAGTGGTGGGGGVQGSGQNSSTAPVLFYSRRIGLNNNVNIPILVGGRLLGRTGPWRFGLLNIQTREETKKTNAASTNFSVARLQRDLLRRSRVGVIMTYRDPIASTKAGADGPSNLAYGADTLIAPTNEISITSYVAQTKSPDKKGDDLSYRGRFDWNNDKYGIQGEHLAVEANFNPEVGFLRRTAFRRSFGQARYSPRPDWRGIRKIYYVGSYDYITDTKNTPESKELQGSFQMDFNNSDAWSVEASRNYERLIRPLDAGKSLLIPAGEYDFQQVRGVYTLGPQRPVSGSITATRGSFYDGTLSELTWRGRVEFSRQFYVEPTLSWNHVEERGKTAESNIIGSRVTYTLSPRMFVSALAQFQSRTDTLTTNARFRWEYLPGSELFIVYSDGRNTLGERLAELDSRSIVVKITRLWRR